MGAAVHGSRGGELQYMGVGDGSCSTWEQGRGAQCTGVRKGKGERQ